MESLRCLGEGGEELINQLVVQAARRMDGGGEVEKRSEGVPLAASFGSIAGGYVMVNSQTNSGATYEAEVSVRFGRSDSGN